ncbi:hypothetical protein ACWCSH_37180, partial [Streptosporangium sp. NPDC001682]
MTSSDDLEARLLDLGESLDVPSPHPAEVARAVRARLEVPAPEAPAVTGGRGVLRRGWGALRA